MMLENNSHAIILFLNADSSTEMVFKNDWVVSALIEAGNNLALDSNLNIISMFTPWSVDDVSRKDTKQNIQALLGIQEPKSFPHIVFVRNLGKSDFKVFEYNIPVTKEAISGNLLAFWAKNTLFADEYLSLTASIAKETDEDTKTTLVNMLVRVV